MLRAAVDAAPNLSERGGAAAKVGICLAQLGQFEEAESILANLRQEFSVDVYPAINLRVMILEAVIAYYKNINHLSLDRIRRVFVLANACSADEIASEAAVWLAHFSFNFEDYFEFKRGIEFSLAHFECLSDTYRSRICLTIADTYQFLGDRERSQNWYTCARILSRQAHDHGLIAAIEHNRLAIGLSRVRAERARKQSEVERFKRNWEVELASVQRLIEGFGGNSLPELVDLSDCFACQLREDYAGAVRAMDRIEAAGAIERCGMTKTLFEIERSWCLSCSGIEVGITAEGNLSLSAIEALPLNDQLVALPLLFDIYSTSRISMNLELYRLMLSRAENYYYQTLDAMKDGLSVADDQWLKIQSSLMSRN
jgi:tetratricopeptide (TPR) repeat protein